MYMLIYAAAPVQLYRLKKSAAYLVSMIFAVGFLRFAAVLLRHQGLLGPAGALVIEGTVVAYVWHLFRKRVLK